MTKPRRRKIILADGGPLIVLTPDQVRSVMGIDQIRREPAGLSKPAQKKSVTD